MGKHYSVLLKEAINYLNIKEKGIYVDMTLGYGGHSKEILKRNKKGFLFAFDKDIEAIEFSKKTLSKVGSNYKIFNESFINIKESLNNEKIEEVDGIIFDLGISSPEIDETNRGFSYMKDHKLDMRMDQSQKLSAYEVINDYSMNKLIKIFREYGEEKNAGRIAKRICEYRETKKIETTLELVDIIDKSIPYRFKSKGHDAKKVFQAIRIEVNDELEEEKKAIRDGLEMLAVNGIMVVISFHSLEDRICKHIFKEYTQVDPLIKGDPNANKNLFPDYELVTRKAILPSDTELGENARSKSSKMRVIKRIK